MYETTNATVQQNALTLTSGTTTIGNIVPLTYGGGMYQNMNYVYGRRATDYTWWPQYVHPALPIWCSGDLHVFGCEHAEKCKCGKASRTPEPKVCACCGK